jgi:aminopeptidase N
METILMRHALLLATALTTVAALPAAARAEAPFDFARNPGQLPKTVVPSHYAIDIVTDMATLTLTGHETIDVTVASPGTGRALDSITLNQAGLKLVQATMDGRAAVISQDEKAQTATLRFECRATRCVRPGPHTLVIDYTGTIPQTPNGIYYDDYKDPAGASKRMLVTQFEVADARRMFPGWDEPSFKATFALSVTLPKTYVPVSNMPVVSSTPAGADARHVVFATSPRMSSYLLALVAGDLSALHGSGGNTPINAYAPTGEQDRAAYALKAAEVILPYYNTYFGVAYPLPKLDLLAIPGNYEAGAMENWGAITFIDDAVLFNPQTSSPNTQEEIYFVVAHEMAHQWSGDLVTMGWWDNIWLNEGFATWMENKATDHFNPSWQVWPRQHSDREAAMAQDALPTTHPIQQVIHDISEADAAFDNINYEKGGEIIRMVEDWLGPDVFRNGMRAYMKAHAYSNTTSADLWQALSLVSHKDVAAVATSFTGQPGIPLVSVSRACQGGITSLTLTQSRFTIHDPHPKALVWKIPVSVGGPGVAAQKILLDAQPVTLRVPGCKTAVKVNFGENGYYRTRYDAASLSLLESGFAKLDATDRVNLLGDQFALFASGQAPLSAYLNLVAALPKTGETSFAVWQDTISHLLRLDVLERGSPTRPAFREFARGVLNAELARLSLAPRPGESFLDSLLRPRLLTALGTLDDGSVTAAAQRDFAAYLKNPASLSPSLLDPVTLIVGMHADAATYATLAKLGNTAPDTEQKLRYAEAMAASRDPKLIAASVQAASSGAIPNGRVAQFIDMIARGSDNPDLVWKLVQPNQGPLRARLTPQGQTFLLPAIAYDSTSPEIARALLADPASSASTGAKIEAARAADYIATTAEMRDRAQPALAAWLAGRS